MRRVDRWSSWLMATGFAMAVWVGGGLVLSEDAGEPVPSNPAGSPRAPSPTVSPGAFRERVLLLNNGKVIKGVIRQSATGYVVNMPGGYLVLPFDQVRLEAEDLEDAYRQQRDTLKNPTAAARIELARWCLTNHLPDQARRELREALRLEPDSTLAKNMLQRINDQQLAVKELPQVAQRNGEFSMLGDVKLGVPVDTLGGLPREAAIEFVSKVQPLLVNRCARAGCHGPGSGNSLELLRAKVGKGTPKSYSERNLAAILDRIDRDRPLRSPLLVKLRGEANSFGTRSGHGGLTTEQLQTVRNWIEAIANKPTRVPQGNKPSDNESESAKSDDQRARPAANGQLSVPAAPIDGAQDDFFRRVRSELRAAANANDSRDVTGSTSDE